MDIPGVYKKKVLHLSKFDRSIAATLAPHTSLTEYEICKLALNLGLQQLLTTYGALYNDNNK
jgi:hypothetical protein